MTPGARRADGEANSPRLSRFSRLSTGFKLFLILSLALLPLGLIAFFATLQSSRTADLDRQAQVRIALTESTRKIAATVAGDVALVSAAMKSMIERPEDATICPRIKEIIAAQGGVATPFAIFGPASRPLCAAGNLAMVRPSTLALGDAERQEIAIGDDGLGIVVRSASASVVGVIRYPRTLLADMASPGGFTIDHALTLYNDSGSLPVVERVHPGGLAGSETLSAPIGATGINAEIQVARAAFSAAEIVAILLPLVMWAAAAAIGWAVVDRLLIKPLRQLERDVSAYKPGAVLSPLETVNNPAFELRQLADTFRTISEMISSHEGELAEGLARQTKLTREVHHRVKNNLQVVASLINLHARGVGNPEVARAYASIQRRVDALAVVHRNHFAELEENRGVALRPLIGELAQNLRGSIPEGSAAPTLALDIQPVYVSQDVAVPVAFLLTELFELAMNARQGARIAIGLVADGAGKARLSMVSDALTASEALAEGLGARYGRVLEGLSRQLRSPFDFDQVAGSFALDIPITGLEDF